MLEYALVAASQHHEFAKNYNMSELTGPNSSRALSIGFAVMQKVAHARALPIDVLGAARPATQHSDSRTRNS